MKISIKAFTTLLVLALSSSATAQLGRQQGLVEPNVAADSVLVALPHMTPALAQSLKDAKPILSVVALDSILASKSVTKAQRAELLGRMFVHVDVNRGTDAEFLLIPGMDANKLKAIKAGRPHKSFANPEVARIEQFVFIPVELNTFVNETMDTFASIGVGTRQWKREFAEYRPWTSMEQFDREISKYLRSRPNELKRLARYVIIEPSK